MSYLLDTNVLLRSVQPSHSQYTEASEALIELRKQGEQLVLVAQNLYEFWVVATRPEADNGLGMSVATVTSELTRLRNFFTVLADTPAVLTEWEALVTNYGVMGKNAHDARLVAAMKTHGISHLLTFNISDFQRYQGITIRTPQEVRGQSPAT